MDKRLETGLAARASATLTPSSSEGDVPLNRPDCLLLLRVIVLFVGDSPPLVHVGLGDFEFWLAAVAFGIAVPVVMRALRRREDSFDFLRAFSSRSRGSLLITSARALPTEVKFNDCRSDARVVGLAGRDGFEVVSGDMRTRIK